MGKKGELMKEQNNKKSRSLNNGTEVTIEFPIPEVDT
jgi:hypothetical protein